MESSSASGSSSNSNGGEKSAPAPAPAPMPAANAPPPFLVKTYEMVDDPSTDKIVSWSPTNNSFVVWDSAEFGRDLLPKYFKHNNFSSFVRQLNTYGFRKVDPDRWEFANEGFLRGQKHLLKTISRRKPAHGQPQQQQQQQQQKQQQPPNGQSSAVGACVEVGKFGLEEEVERLKRDKNVLMQELVRLRQQQQTTDGQLQTMVKRLQGMEQRQQQMMSFLAKAVNSPGFLAQFMQQPTDSNRRITEGSKKRRLKQDDDSVGPSDSQIVKYQPLMNEAAQSMLRQIIKLGSSPVLENFGNQSESFLIGDGLSAPTTIDCGSSLNRVSSVTLQEVPPASAPSFITSGSSAMISEVKSQSLGPTSDVATNQFSEMPPMSVPLTDAIMPELSEMPPMSVPLTDAIMPELSEMVSESNVDIMGSESESNGFLDPASLTASDNIPIEIDKFPLEIGGFSPDPNIEWDDSLLDGIQGLPGGADNFWEKFFDIASPIETDMDSTLTDNPLEETETNPPENGWDKSQHMAELTQQMGLLTSEAKKV